jgi:hypothetical protein
VCLFLYAMSILVFLNSMLIILVFIGFYMDRAYLLLLLLLLLCSIVLCVGIRGFYLALIWGMYSLG